jgi:hypothetical protein
VTALQVSPRYTNDVVRICPDCGPNDDADFYRTGAYCKPCTANRVKANRHQKGVQPRVPQAQSLAEYDFRNPTRQCNTCGHVLDISDFPPHHNLKKQRWDRAYDCRDCYNAYIRDWGKSDVGVRSRRNYALKSKYGIDIETFEGHIRDQDGKCSICSNPFDNRKGFRIPVVDHDHATGQFRGIICWTCNTLLGRVEDNKETLRQMIDYLG